MTDEGNVRDAASGSMGSGGPIASGSGGSASSRASDASAALPPADGSPSGAQAHVRVEAPMQAVRAFHERVITAVRPAIVGMDVEIEAALTALLAGGHVLLEGPPGVAKTLLARALSTALGGSFARIQFTPDLMPADVTGTSIFHPARGVFDFQAGPIFAHVVLCDEINRAPAKTQSALLEAMQEGAVTVDGRRHALPQPYTVFATMNPIEHEGTYPLPEAQLDRFVFKVLVKYPPQDLETQLLSQAHTRALDATPQSLGVRAVSSPEEVLALRHKVLSVTVRADMPAYVVRLVRATRADRALVVGASPRAGVMMLAAAKARAGLHGRDFVTPDDVKAVFLPALRHRVVLDPGEEIEGASADDILRRILDEQEVPR
jgi:MoxR-like ATPase